MRLAASILLVGLLLLPACITDNTQTRNMQAQLDMESQRVQELSRRVELLSQSVSGSRQPQANLANEINSLRQEVARLNGRLEETQRGAVPAGASSSADEAQIQGLDRRLGYVERYLGIASAPQTRNTTASTASGTTVVSSTPATPEPGDPNADPQTIFDAGMRLFKQNSLQAARDRFEQLLKLYPNHKLTEQAQFWLGETLFADRKYEEAILAYNQLIKRYPSSKNLLTAQLKQGMSFAELGDAQAAKIIFNKIIADHPNSTEAKTAKEQLSKLR